jgi:RNA polymerase sigma-70 factor (ECF subfamily)
MDALELSLVTPNEPLPAFAPAGCRVNGPAMGKDIPSSSWAGLGTSGLAELVDGCRRGEPRDMEAVYLLLKKPVFNIAYRYTGNRSEAEDLVQDVFVKVFTHMTDVKDPATFPAWVFRIAVNACFSRLRRQRAAGGPPVTLDEVEAVVPSDDAGSQDSESDFRGALERALAGLPPKLRQVFILHDVQGFKHEEISGIMKCSVGTSKSQLFKARMRIRGALRRDGAVKEQRS